MGRRKPDEETEMGHGRRIPDLQELKELTASKEAKLKLIEIVMMVLYTGPMVVLTMLRAYTLSLLIVLF
jgi:hypothetical protein